MKKKFLSYVILAFIIFLVLSFNAFPNFWAYLNTPQGMSFTGQASWFDPWDINLYVSIVKSGQNNGLLLSNDYTTTPNQPILFYPLYTLTGFLFTGVNPFLLFHILAAVFGLLLMLIIWKITGVFLNSLYDRLISLFLITTGGGVGGFFFPQFKSADIFMTSFTFTSSFQRAHEAVGVILYLIALATFYLAINQKKFIFSAISIISLSGLVVIYPYYLLSYFLIVGIYSLYKKAFVFLIINLLAVTPVFLWYNSILRSNPTLSGVLTQKLPTPNIIEVLLGWGILVPLLILQFKNPKRDSVWVFLNIWVGISLFLAYLPFGFSRFYLRGLFFPIIILIIFSLPNLTKIIHLSKKKILIILIVLLPISTFYITYKRIQESQNSNPWYYLSSGQRQSIEFLNSLPPKSNILTYYTMGNMIPSNTNHNVYAGHLIQTPDATNKLYLAELFFTNRLPPPEAKKFITLNNLNLIYWGPEEQAITKKYSQANKLGYPFLRPIFQNQDIYIYTVDNQWGQ